VGELIAKKAILKNISYIVFDRGNKPYHGRIKNVAEGARKEGLIF
jgi:large subunit ribosomal protein L18